VIIVSKKRIIIADLWCESVRKAFDSAVSLRLCMSVSVPCFCYERVVIECFKGTGLGRCSE